MEWYFGRKISKKILDSSDARRINKLQRTDGYIYVSPGIQERSEEQSYINEDRQHFCSGIHQQDDGTIGSSIPIGKSSIKPNKGAQLQAHGTTHSRSGQYHSGSAILLGGQKRLDAALKVLQDVRNKMGPHTINQMASFTNHQVPRYNSYHWDLSTEAIDTYSCI
jgi:hypothetical protein